MINIVNEGVVKFDKYVFVSRGQCGLEALIQVQTCPLYDVETTRTHCAKNKVNLRKKN